MLFLNDKMPALESIHIIKSTHHPTNKKPHECGANHLDYSIKYSYS